MSIIDFEVEEIRKICEDVVPHSKIITCTSAEPAPLIRVDIKENQVRRQLTVCLRFPKDYPNETILVELKSRTLVPKFLDALVVLCEKQANLHRGKPQGMKILNFVQQYLHDNPLCVCVDEIQQLRRDLGSDVKSENLKLKQRSSTIQLTAQGGAYYYTVRAVVPDNYPLYCVDLQKPESNLPAVLVRYINGQSREIARQCVEPPVRLSKDEMANFQPVPSLYCALKFCLEATHDFYTEICPICDNAVLPVNPKDLELDDTKDGYVERVCCGHLFHQGCLKKYVQEPPFLKGGKLCPAKRRHSRSDARCKMVGNTSNLDADKQTIDNTNAIAVLGSTCNIPLAHDRWVINVKLAESRWAQKQARERELQEVVDFLK